MTTVTPALRLTHDLVAALHAEMQGRFVMLNVLRMLGHPLFEPGALDGARARLDSLQPASAALWSGRPLFPAVPVTDVPERSALIVQLFGASRAEVVEAAVRAACVSARDPSREDLALLLACRAWSAYGFEHLLKSYVHFGETFGDETLADRSRQQLLAAQDGIRRVHVDLEALQAGADDPDLAERMLSAAVAVVGVLIARAESMAGILDELGLEPDPLPPHLVPAHRQLLSAYGLQTPS